MSATDSANNQMQRENKDEMVAVAEDHCNERAVKAESSMSSIIPSSGSRVTIPDSSADFKDWLEGIKMVARLPGGMPVEFRRKLWLALAERYLKRRGVDWEIEKVKWFSEQWRADDEELGIQIVKDLHRTGHSLLSGPDGTLNQAKLKKILLGYTRWNPEVGYCQGFNMLGAIILQVMDKSEVDSIKVLIFLIEGLLPVGYFCGSLMGLQIDMAVFRELLGKKLPKLARHLQKLQYPNNEPTTVEPPLINVFTMQWFLTLFCNCLPMSSVLRIWDLIMIEGSDVLLRTALSIWKLLEEKILREVRTADDFYCKMENLMAEILNENMMDSNVMVQLISDLGPIRDLQKLRHKHLTASYNDQKQLKMMYSKAQGESERLAVANAWQNNRPRRGSQQLQSDREKIALDITILKKQYDKLRERQKQAHIILSSAVSKQNQQEQKTPSTNVNKLLVGKHAIISKGRKGPPKGAIPPARKAIKTAKTPSSSTSSSATVVKNTAMNEPDTLHWKNTDEAKRRKNSLTWKEINAESPRKSRSDSSSYSENSDSESSPSTSLCDEENLKSLDTTPVKKKRHKDIKKKKLEEESNSAKSEEPPVEKVELSVPDSEVISSISQLSPMPDISSYFSTAISPIKSPSNYYDFSSRQPAPEDEISEQGVTNEFFERVTSSNAFNMLPPKLKHVNQKSLSMEEESLGVKEDVGRINRSFSDGTIISNDAGDIFQKIIAENSKILTKFSNESLSSSTRTLLVEPILEETKSSEENSSECEEIAAIDVAEECTIPDGIQDIAELALESSYSDTKPSTTSCDADDDVTVQNEKSMNGKNSEDETALATLHTTCNATLTLESLAQKSLPLKDDEKVISPKFSEISALVDKLKRDMESDLNTKELVKSEEVKVNAEIEVKDVENVVSAVQITINCEDVTDLEKCSEKIDEPQIKKQLDTSESTKVSENEVTAFPAKDSSSILEKLNAQLQRYEPRELEAQRYEPTVKPHRSPSSERVIDYKRELEVQRYEPRRSPSTERTELEAQRYESRRSPSTERRELEVQRYEPTVKPHRSPSSERVNDYKKELEVLLKERELEKMSKSATYRYEEPPQAIAFNSSSTSALYDHEPRNEIRRRDIASLESTQQTRRPFKSSPSSSLSSSPSNNIHDTLSSIQNTIKSLDSACQRSEIYNYKKLDKAMESIEKICESDREWHFYKFTKKLESPPLFKIDDVRSYDAHGSDFTRRPKTPELDPNYLAKLRGLSTEEYIAGRKSPLGLSPTKERSYDRYSRIDRSPTSPSLSSRFLKSPTGDRTSKSAENSPSRYGGDTTSTRYARVSPSSSFFLGSDLKAESMSNLSFKPTENKKYYEFEWEKTSTRRKYDI